MQLQVPVSVGEVLDKITILQIKLAHISDANKRVNIQNELDALCHLWLVMVLPLTRCRG